eukprot:TRINITY_DN7467_c0_g1_i4.p1 TRINITY_DN7467_c0_g1~~TRINITY_DN7467_c0_g1_i4.p1  ORF type:complete len:103 (+),score=30.42 TRINITY_DN7467_c0_g1_i4:15-323(+)
MSTLCYIFFFFQAEDGIRDLVRSRGLGDVYKRQVFPLTKVKSFVVKEAAKRAMMYLLQVPRGDEATRAVLSSLGAESSTMRDYVARTLRKLAAEGDSDDDTA